MQPAHAPLQPFLAYLRFEKRYSQHTLLAYQTDLTDFFDYLTTTYGGCDVAAISHLFVRSWLVALKDSGQSATTLNRKISSLKSFFKYQLKMGVVQQSPMAKVVSPKVEKRLPQFVAQNHMDTLFRHVAFADNWQGQTDRLLLQLFYQTGMRLSEVISLRENAVDHAGGQIKILGKGNKERLVPIGAALQQQIQLYCKAKAGQEWREADDTLLLNEKGKKLSPRRVYDTVKKYLSIVSTIDQRSPHVLRHTFATHLMNKGADLNAVKELLGHSSLAATQVYTHNTIEKLKEVHKKAHPKA